MHTDTVVVGASGYIGGRLVDTLIAGGTMPRVAGRRPEALARRWPEAHNVELDVLRPDTIEPAIRGADVVYYLVHAMAEGEAGFEERDRVAASSFAIAAKRAGVGRVVYLGGLGSQADQLSAHLASRHETGQILAHNGPKVLELRAGMVIGAGSASFRMLMDLVKRLPVMITPRWVETRSQPIAIGDVVTYLEHARSLDLVEQHTIVEIGGADVLSYLEMMRRAAAFRGRHPAIITVPVLTPRLSSLWCGLVTSVPSSIARPLIDGLRNETIVRDDSATRLFPDVHPMGFDDAVAEAIREDAKAS
jgi:uncharacterized protein YbjT (DUF2867 family)